MLNDSSKPARSTTTLRRFAIGAAVLAALGGGASVAQGNIFLPFPVLRLCMRWEQRYCERGSPEKRLSCKGIDDACHKKTGKGATCNIVGKVEYCYCERDIPVPRPGPISWF